MAWSDNALLTRRLRPGQCGAVYRPEDGWRVAVYGASGALEGLYTARDCPVAELTARGCMVFEQAAERQEHILRFALMDLVNAGSGRLGACGEMKLQTGSATGLYKLLEKARYPDALTFGNAYVALQRDIEKIWRRAAEQLRDGRPWNRDDWRGELNGIAPLAWEETARLLMGYGLILPKGGASLKDLAPLLLGRGG